MNKEEERIVGNRGNGQGKKSNNQRKIRKRETFMS